MKVQRGGSLLERQLRAEIRRILLLLERSRLTRRRVRLLIALRTGASRRASGTGSAGARRRQGYRRGA
jgi:hypothetical protein